MHLRSISMKGFKSFPNRTKLEFAPGVAVVVGPNGSGKSNITDAVLWALGEQSPLAVRGQTMKDVIFAGGHGVKGSSAAEVEVVIDNGDGGLDTEFGEISIVRRLDRQGEGEYRLNGARCRLTDIVEVLSDTGLGKEMHSVVSQGRVEAIVLSRPRDRRLLIEEAAGLGKHRKRRRRAQLKLERTEENLSRALDVEREARSRLRPLKRQAEAAELHERLERQTLEARYELSRDCVRDARGRARRGRGAGGRRAGRARGGREAAGRRRQAARAGRGGVRGAHPRARGAAGPAVRRGLGTRANRDPPGARPGPGARGRRRRGAARRALEVLQAELAEAGDPSEGTAERIAAMEAELAALEGERERARARGRPGAGGRACQAEARGPSSRRPPPGRAGARGGGRRRRPRARRREAERALERPGPPPPRPGAELAAVNQYLRAAGAPADVTPLSESLESSPGTSWRWPPRSVRASPRASSTASAAGETALDSAGDDGGLVIVSGTGRPRRQGTRPAGAERLLDRVTPSVTLRRSPSVCSRAYGWSTPSPSPDFEGVAVTRSGRVWRPGAGELRQSPAGGPERVLEHRNRRTELVAASEAPRAEAEARAAWRPPPSACPPPTPRATRPSALRRALREVEGAAEAGAPRRLADGASPRGPDEGPDAVRRAELTAEVRAERRVAESAVRERDEREARAAALRARIARDGALAEAAGRAATALEAARTPSAGGSRAGGRTR